MLQIGQARTAAQILADADALPETGQAFEPMVGVGSDPTRRVSVPATELVAFLARWIPVTANVRFDKGGWEFHDPATGIRFLADGYAAMRERAVADLRSWARGSDQDTPLSWMLLVATDAELHTWLGFPTDHA